MVINVICKNCGNIISNDKVCEKCGTPVDTNIQNTAVATPMVMEQTSFVNPNINTITNPDLQQNNTPVTNDILQPIIQKTKNPNLVLYIVLIIVIIVAIACVTLVITKGNF